MAEGLSCPSRADGGGPWRGASAARCLASGEPAEPLAALPLRPSPLLAQDRLSILRRRSTVRVGRAPYLPMLSGKKTGV